MTRRLSLGRGEVTELTHLAPIRAGMVPGIATPLTYADRLRALLGAFEAREAQSFPSVIRIFRGVHFAKWSLIDGDTRLLLSVVFDGDWHDYLRALVRDVPGFLHLIWSNCEGFLPLTESPRSDPSDRLSLDQRTLNLFEFIQRYQVKLEFFYAHHFDLTVQDIYWLKELRRAAESDRRTEAERVIAATFRASSPLPRSERLERAIRAWVANRETKTSSAREPTAREQLAFKTLLGSLYRPFEVALAFEEAFGKPIGEF